MAVITGSSKAIRYGIELDSYRADAAARVLDHVIQGDALSAHARVESFGLIYANPPFDAEFGESGNQRFEVLFLSTSPAGSSLRRAHLRLAGTATGGCAQVLASHFRDTEVFRLESQNAFCTNRLWCSPLHAPGESGTAFATRKSHSAGTAWSPQHGSMRCCRFCRRGESNCEFRRPVPPKFPTLACPSMPSRTCCPRLRRTGRFAQLLDPQPISITTQPLTPLHKGTLASFRQPAS